MVRTTLQAYLLLLSALLLSYAGHAQRIQVFNGALTATTSATVYFPYPNTDLPSCDTPKTLNSLGTSNSPLIRFPYAVYTVTNPYATPTCITLTLRVDCAEPDAEVVLLVLTGTPNVGLPSSNQTLDFLYRSYRSDSGGWHTPGSATTFSVLARPGESLTLVVTTRKIDMLCSKYTVIVSIPEPSAPILFSFFPNPVTDWATVTSPIATTLTLYDAVGRLCHQFPLAVGSQQLNLKALAAGTYFLRDETTQQVTHFVKASP